MTKVVWEKRFKKKIWGRYPDLSIVRSVKNYFGKKKNKKALDLGYGGGSNLFFLLKEKFKVFGLDHSQNAKKQAINHLKEYNFSLTKNLVIGDVSSIPFKDNFFDLVIDCECLYAIPEKNFLLTLPEIRRVLKNKSIFISKTFSSGSFTDGYKPLIKNKLYKNNIGLLKRYMSLRDIKNTYGKFFEIVNIEKEIRTVNNQKNKIIEWIIVMKNEK